MASLPRQPCTNCASENDLSMWNQCQRPWIRMEFFVKFVGSMLGSSLTRPQSLSAGKAPGDSMFLIAWVKVDLDPLSSSGNCRTLSPTEITEGEQMVGNQGQATMTSTSSRHKEVRCWISILAQSVWEQSNHMQATRGQLKSACSEWISSSARKFCGWFSQQASSCGVLTQVAWMFLETMNQIW